MRSKKFFLLGVFLLAALLTSLGSPLFAYDVQIYGLEMKELRNGYFLTDQRFYENGKKLDNPTIQIASGGSARFCLVISREDTDMTDIRRFRPYVRVYNTTKDKLEHLTYSRQGGDPKKFNITLNDSTSSYWKALVDNYVIKPDRSGQVGEYNHVEFDINVLSTAPENNEYNLEILAFPDGGFHQAGLDQKDFTQKFTIKVMQPTTKATITLPAGVTSIDVDQGSTASIDLTGTNVTKWYIDYPSTSKLGRARLDYIRLDPGSLDSAGNYQKCTITVQASKLDENTHDSTWTIKADNKYGEVTSLELKINVFPTAGTSLAQMVPASVTVKQGETASVVLTGNDSVYAWYRNNDEAVSPTSTSTPSTPSPIDSIFLSYDQANPKTCTAYITANPDAKPGSYSTYVYVYNELGKRGEDGRLDITVTLNDDHMKPTIDSNEEITVIQGGVASAIFYGKYAKAWTYESTLSEDIISNITLNYSKSTNVCVVQVTAAEDATDGTYELPIYALNAVGQKSDPATLKITINKNADHENPTIDENETVTVIPGKSASTVFTGKHTRSWKVDESDVAKYDWIDAIECSYVDNPDRCDVYVFTNASADEQGTSATIKVYAYNAVGEQSNPATLTILAANPDAYKKPVIDTSESVTVIAGGTAKAVFTGQHIRRWNYSRNFSDDIHDIELNYATNPSRCEVLVTADPNAAEKTYHVTIYAYNVIGEETSADLEVTVIVDETKYDDPVIDEPESVSVIAGGTAKTVFTGQHIRAWKYGNLPDDVKAVELNYSSNPNRCEVLVTASSTATASATPSKVTIYAYNEIGEETSAELSVKITAPTYDPPKIDKNEEVTVIAGGTARAILTGKNVKTWKYGNLPDAVKAVELNYSSNPNRCEVLVTAGSTATAGTYTVTMYAYNEVGSETSADLTVTVTTKTYDAATIDKNEEVTVLAGGTARAILTGKNVKTWKYGNLPDGVTAVELNYSTNTNRCEVLVTTSEAVSQDTTATIDIYAYNEVGKVVASPAKLTVSIITMGTSDQPKITTAPSSVDVVPGGTVSAVFKGEGISFWTCDNASFLLDGVELSYQDDTNTCTVFITASSFLAEGLSDDITITAYNNQGDSVSKTLTVNIVENANAPKIDVLPMKDQFKAVIPGGTVRSVLRGKNIVTWKIGNDTPSFLTALARPDPDDPSICDIFITIAPTAKISDVITAEADGGYFIVYGYDSTGNEALMPIFIEVVDPSSIASTKPAISGDQSVSVAPGGSVSATFKATNVYDWNYSELTTTELSSVKQKYDRDNDPSTNTVTVEAASTAKAGDYHVTVYAYNENGLEDSADLKVTVAGSGGGVVSSSGGGCDMGFAGLGVLALALTFMKAKHSK